MTIRILLGLLTITAAHAQPSRTLADDPWCNDADSSQRARSCEVREFVIQHRDLDIDATPNGSVSVKRWDRSDILIRARVQSHARGDRQSRAGQGEIRVDVEDGQIRARVENARNGQWGQDGNESTVNYQVFAPRQTSLRIRTLNGSAAVYGIDGDVDIQSVNGSIALSDVAGDVHARAVNGSVSVDLSGGAWSGRGLAASTTNGSVVLKVRPGFSATLRAQTQVGRIALAGLDVERSDRQRGRWSGDEIETRMGRGGAPVDLSTVNGSVRIEQVR